MQTNAESNTNLRTLHAVLDYLQHLQEDVSQTLTNQIFVLVAAGVCVGLTTKDAIDALTHEALSPAMVWLQGRSLVYIGYNHALRAAMRRPWLHALLSKVGSIAWILLLWLVIAYVTVLLVRYALKIELITPHTQLARDASSYVFGQQQQQGGGAHEDAGAEQRRRA